MMTNVLLKNALISASVGASLLGGSALGQTTFSDDLGFLKQHTDVVVLKNESGAAVAIAPDWQARVMTSTWSYDGGASMGWLNRPVIEQGILSDDQRKGTNVEKIHAFGGEERFWIGPEAGQFGFYFAPGVEFSIANWFTPHAIDTEEFDTDYLEGQTASFSHLAQLVNHQGKAFKIGVKREIELLESAHYASELGVDALEGLSSIGYSTTNTITNQGDFAWNQEVGMPSIWLLGMYPASESNLIYIPTKGAQMPEVNDSYFGKVSADDLQVAQKGLTMRANAQKRLKIGVKEKDSIGLAASYNPTGKTLTIVKYIPQDAPNGYVNSLWKIQDAPFSGDVINAYNDGPATPGGGQLGNFFELETSSPAAALKPSEAMTHKQFTFHFHGEKEVLNTLSQKVLGVTLSALESTF